MNHTNWQSKRPLSGLAKYNKDSPALVSIATYLVAVFGGANVGLRQVRNARGKNVLSSHAYGSALDWSYRGKGRQVGLDAINFLIANAEALGVSAIHDYIGCRIWKSDRQSWKSQKKDKEGMGQPWGDWLHIEITAEAWSDGRPVEAKLGTLRPLVSFGSTGPAVQALQEILIAGAGQPVTVNGVFDTQTLMGWRNVAAFCKLPADDTVNGADWDTLAWIDKGWGRLNAVGIK
jgi:hypothetical protein